MQSKKGREEKEGGGGGRKAEEARGEGKEGCRGSAGQGMAWQARPMAWHEMACHGMAWQDRAVAWQGWAGQARPGQASDRAGQGRAGEASVITVCVGSLHKTEITKENKQMVKKWLHTLKKLHGAQPGRSLLGEVVRCQSRWHFQTALLVMVLFSWRRTSFSPQ